MNLKTFAEFRFAFCSVLFAFCFLFFVACGGSKNAVSSTSPNATTGVQAKNALQVWQSINDDKKSINWLSGDFDLDYKGKPMNIGASAKIIWHRDSVIWIKITKLGFIQVARAKITRDSVFIVNQIQSQYLAESLSYLETKYGIPADFTTIQNILLGNPVSLTPANELKLEKNTTDLNLLLSGSSARYKNSFFIHPTNFSLQKMLIEEPAQTRTITIENLKPDALSVGTQSVPFSLQRIITFNSPKTGTTSVSIENYKETIEVNVPKTIVFVPPVGYSKM